MKPGEMKIYKALMDHEQGLTFTELKKETKLSAPVLSEYLKNLQLEGSVNKNVAVRKYQLTRAYLPKTKLYGIEKALRFLVFFAPAFAVKIKQVKNEAKRMELVKHFLKMYFMSGSSIVIFFAIGSVLDEWFEKGEERIDLLSSMLNEQIRNWVGPYIQKLALALVLIEEDYRNDKVTLDEITETWLTEVEKTRMCIEKTFRKKG